VGRLLPRGNRAPAIVPVRPESLVRLIGAEPALAGWSTGRTERIGVGFYTSQALELSRR
jgi:magnesium-protoporphyrin O-methyltransferase